MSNLLMFEFSCWDLKSVRDLGVTKDTPDGSKLASSLIKQAVDTYIADSAKVHIDDVMGMLEPDPIALNPFHSQWVTNMLSPGLWPVAFFWTDDWREGYCQQTWVFAVPATTV